MTYGYLFTAIALFIVFNHTVGALRKLFLEYLERRALLNAMKSYAAELKQRKGGVFSVVPPPPTTTKGDA